MRQQLWQYSCVDRGGASSSASPQKPTNLKYGEPAVASNGNLYIGNGQGKVTELISTNGGQTINGNLSISAVGTASTFKCNLIDSQNIKSANGTIDYISTDRVSSSTVNSNFISSNTVNCSTVITDSLQGDFFETLLSRMLDKIYPVGSVYISFDSKNPSEIFGGSWEQIQGRFLLSASGGYSVGSTGGEASHTLSVNEMPSHSHTRGDMNITGFFDSRPHETGLTWTSGGVVGSGGAFYWQIRTAAGNNGVQQSSNSYAADRVQFDASRTWTGNTSSAGSGWAHNNMPPYIVTYMWRRTA